jgi:hypothetical protein
MIHLTGKLTAIITTTIMEVMKMIWKQYKINVTEGLEQVLQFCMEGVIAPSM